MLAYIRLIDGESLSPSHDGMRARRLLYSYAAPGRAASQVYRRRSSPTVSPSCVVFAIVDRLLHSYTAVVNRDRYCSLAIIAQAWRAFLCARATLAILKPRRSSRPRNQRLWGSSYRRGFIQ